MMARTGKQAGSAVAGETKAVSPAQGPAILRRIGILGAGGRDFHNFNRVYRHDPAVRVVAFGATQIPGIENRLYPPELSGPLYPEGIPIVAAERLVELCREGALDQVVFAYSDVSHGDVMHTASRVLAAGSDFLCLGPRATMLDSRRPVIAVTAVRTGCGKSPASRAILKALQQTGLRVAVLRHPMPYGDLARQSVQRFTSLEDLDASNCSLEEREEFEPYLETGGVVFAGVDYAAILSLAEEEAEIILWDGGNNDFPFIRPDLHVVLADALRPGDETGFHPGETCLRLADHVVIMKVAEARDTDILALEAAIRATNPDAGILHADLVIRQDFPESLAGRRVLVIEDGPTVTHGGMASGAGLLAARRAGAAEVIDPRPHAAAALADLWSRYPHLGPVLPAMGYGPLQLSALEETIRNAAPDVVVSATPVDLERLIAVGVPMVRIRYDYQDRDRPGLLEIVTGFARRLSPARTRG